MNKLKSNILHYVNSCLAVGTKLSTIKKDLDDYEHHRDNFNNEDKEEMSIFITQILELANKGAIK